MQDIYYKYKSLSKFDQFVDIMVNNRLHASKFTDLNDPMEGVFYHFTNRYQRNLADQIIKDKQKLRICSLSKMANSILMWSHYADAHKGVVIGLTIDESVTGNNGNHLKKVYYIPHEEFRNSIIDTNTTAIDILKRKTKVWEYEQEFRVIVPKEMLGENKYVPITVKEIYLGKRISGLHKKLVSELCQKFHPSLRPEIFSEEWV